MKWKKALYYFPGAGLVTHTLNEIKKRRGRKPIYDLRKKEDLKALGNYIVQVSYLTIALVKWGATYKIVENLFEKINKTPKTEVIQKNNLENKILKKSSINYFLKN